MFSLATHLSALTFENFHVTKGNRLVHAAALAVAEKPGTNYNPFFLHSPSETEDMHHLLSAIGNRTEKLCPEKTILYVTGKTVSEELAQRTSGNTITTLFGCADVLLLENIQDLSGASQDYVQGILEHFTTEERQIVISSNLPPKELPMLDFALATQIHVGMVVSIEGDS